MKVITAPEAYLPEEKDVIVFLAGGITGCSDWQSEVIRKLERKSNTDNLVIINPRRTVFDLDDKNKSIEQIKWEHQYLSNCDIFSAYFTSDTVQPITLYELGRYSTDFMYRYDRSEIMWRVLVSIEDGYSRTNDVGIQTLLTCKEEATVEIGTNPGWHADLIYKSYRSIDAVKNGGK